MEPGALSPFAAWDNFYVIVGSSAAALTGLQFVVVVLGADLGIPRSEAASSVFSNPTMVHFCAVLLVAALLSAPWQGVSVVALILALCGAAGLIYVLMILLRARRQTDYKMVLEDWLWHTLLPLIAYGALLGAALAFWSQAVLALYVVGASVLLLLFSGIHNAWDAVTYLAGRRQLPASGEDEKDV